jgi:hypothetical protein
MANGLNLYIFTSCELTFKNPTVALQAKKN